VNVIVFYNFDLMKVHSGLKILSLRDVMKICDFINKNEAILSVEESFKEAIDLVITDGIGVGTEMSEV
jgi:hypothetical protein